MEFRCCDNKECRKRSPHGYCQHTVNGEPLQECDERDSRQSMTDDDLAELEHKMAVGNLRTGKTELQNRLSVHDVVWLIREVKQQRAIVSALKDRYRRRGSRGVVTKIDRKRKVVTVDYD